jgi:hypothetical protein
MDDQLQQLQADVQRLKDIQDIKYVRARFGHLVDAQDWDRWGNEVLTEDYYFDNGSGVYDGRKVAIAELSKSMENGRMVHVIHSPAIELTGPDTAHAVWGLVDYVYIAKGDEGFAFRGAGNYHTDYIRTPDGWRIKRVVLERLSMDAIPFARPLGA